MIEVQTKSPINLNEIQASDCQPAGGIFVNEALVMHLWNQFYDLPPDQVVNAKMCVHRAEESFELSCKREFNIGRDAPPEYVIEAGLGLPGHIDSTILLDSGTVKQFFDEPVHRIVNSIKTQMRGINPKYLFLVGGFGTSKYLRQCIEETFGRRNMQVLFLDDAHGKAASDGSIIWYVRKSVIARAARMFFGIRVEEKYDRHSLEHQARPRQTTPYGESYVSSRWSVVSERDEVFEEKSSSKRDFHRMYPTPSPNLDRFTEALYAWTDDTREPPEWVLDPEGNIIDGFEWICGIQANMSGMRSGLTKHRGSRGNYWELDFEVCLEFGSVELSAHLEWKEKGVIKRGEAIIVAT